MLFQYNNLNIKQTLPISSISPPQTVPKKNLFQIKPLETPFNPDFIPKTKNFIHFEQIYYQNIQQFDQKPKFPEIKSENANYSFQNIPPFKFVINKEQNSGKKEEKKKINNNDENKKDNNSLTHSNITSKYDSDRSSNSDLNLKSDDNDDNSQKKSNFNFARKKKKSNSKQYFSRLSLKPNTIKEIKKSVKSNTKLLHVKFNVILKNPLSKNKRIQKKERTREKKRR